MFQQQNNVLATAQKVHKKRPELHTNNTSISIYIFIHSLTDNIKLIWHNVNEPYVPDFAGKLEYCTDKNPQKSEHDSSSSSASEAPKCTPRNKATCRTFLYPYSAAYRMPGRKAMVLLLVEE
jgi:hypothetical protein